MGKRLAIYTQDGRNPANTADHQMDWILELSTDENIGIAPGACRLQKPVAVPDAGRGDSDNPHSQENPLLFNSGPRINFG